MDSDETPYLLPYGERVRVIKTPTAAELLPHMLERFRFGHLDPLIFGDAGEDGVPAAGLHGAPASPFDISDG